MSGDAAGVGGTEATAGLGGTAGVGETEAAAGFGGSAFGVSTRVVLTGVGAGVVVLVATSVVLVAVVSRRGGLASLCGRVSGLPGGESGFDPELPFRFERLRS